MLRRSGRAAVIVTSAFGGVSRSELEREAVAGARPRKDYVELARILDGDVIDGQYMARSAALGPRLIARWVHFRAGQVAEVFLRPGRYRSVVAWGDFPGLAMAALFKAVRSRRDLVVIAHRTSPPGKAALLKRFNVHTHIRALIYQSRTQFDLASGELGVPRQKLRQVSHAVDAAFWKPVPGPTENLIFAAGVEARDYKTLVEAVRGLDVTLELGVASMSASGDAALRLSGLAGVPLPPNVRLSSPSLSELRSSYSRSRFAVVPLQERDYDAGSTAVAEAMAMGKAVIVTRIRGQVDLLRHGVNGLGVPPGDPAALRAAMEHLLARPDEAERMGRAGRALIEERHTLDGYIASVVQTIGGTTA